MEQAAKKGNTTFGRVLCIIIALCICVLALLLSLQAIVFSQSHFKTAFFMYNIAESVGTDDVTLMNITRTLIDYLALRRDNIDMRAEIFGQDQEVFTQLEKEHMVDVQDLFVIGFRIRDALFIAIPALLILALAVLRRNFLHVMARAQLWVTLLIVIAIAGIAVFFIIDFTSAWHALHLVLFDNDKWLLVPDMHVLIRIVPEEFFAYTGIKIGIYTVSTWVLLLLASAAVTFATKRKRQA